MELPMTSGHGRKFELLFSMLHRELRDLFRTIRRVLPVLLKKPRFFKLVFGLLRAIRNEESTYAEMLERIEAQRRAERKNAEEIDSELLRATENWARAQYEEANRVHAKFRESLRPLFAAMDQSQIRTFKEACPGIYIDDLLNSPSS